MPNFATTLAVLLAVLVGATIVLLCNYVEDRLRGRTARTGFLDVLVPGDGVKYSDFVWIALPPITGGMILAFWPATNGSAAGAAGLLAGFLVVWPMYRFPVQLLREDLRPFWPKLRLFYSLFVGLSAALTYLGFIVVDRSLPVAGTLARARLWVHFLERVPANAIYGPTKYGAAALLVIGGVYFIREWVRIRAQVNGLKPEVVVHEASSPQPRDDV
jgi:hypothetical protein